MNKKNALKWIIGILCALLLLGIVAAAVILDRRSSDPTPDVPQTDPASTSGSSNGTEGGDQGAEDPTGPSEEPVPPPTDLPPTVEVVPEKNPVTGEPTELLFPVEILEYNLVIEKIAPYSGMFVEDGTNAHVENVAMLLVHNKGDYPVEYTQISVTYGQENLLFDVSALPAGEKLVVQEKNGKSVPTEKPTSATAMVVQRAKMDMSENAVRVTDNGNNTLTITNLTNETIPTVRVFYKYYMEEEGLFVGGIAFTVRVARLGGGTSVTVQPSHFTSSTSRVVMVLTYDSEV